jgi:uncharacterized protein
MSQAGVEEDYYDLNLEVKGDEQIRRLTAIHIKLRGTGEAVQITGNYIAEGQLTCIRCLEEFTTTLNLQLEEYLELVHGREGPHGEIDWVASEEDLDVFRGKMLDLTELLRQNAVVFLPMNPLCREDCLGLCPFCGENKNLGPCHCDRQGANAETAISRAFRSAGQDK